MAERLGGGKVQQLGVTGLLFVVLLQSQTAKLKRQLLGVSLG